MIWSFETGGNFEFQCQTDDYISDRLSLESRSFYYCTKWRTRDLTHPLKLASSYLFIKRFASRFLFEQWFVRAPWHPPPSSSLPAVLSLWMVPFLWDCSSHNSLSLKAKPYFFHFHSCFPIAWLSPSLPTLSFCLFHSYLSSVFGFCQASKELDVCDESGPRDPSHMRTPLEHQLSHSTLICPISAPFHGNGCWESERAPGLQRSPALS